MAHTLSVECVSFNKSTSYLLLCLSPNSSWDKTSRTWGSMLKPPPQVEEADGMLSQACRAQSSCNQKVDDADSHLPHHPPITTHRKNAHELITLSLNHFYKTSHCSLQVGTHSYEGISPLWPLLPWQSNKDILFYFAPSPLKIWPCKNLQGKKNQCERLKPFERYVLLFFSSQHVFLKQQFYFTSHISTLNSIPHSAMHNPAIRKKEATEKRK